MNILITGAEGFIGKNLSITLQNIKDGKDINHSNIKIDRLFLYDVNTDHSLLNYYCEQADFVFNFAGVNRPENESEYMTGNFGFTSELLDALNRVHNTCPVMFSSSIQALLNNPYGESKKAGEELFIQHAVATGAKVLVYRFPNVFGKWCRPNYNSAIATFCYNIANDLPIVINDRNTVMKLVYIDDLINELIDALAENEHRDENYCFVPKVYTKTLGEIADIIYSFKSSRNERSIPDMSDEFIKKLYATYLSYLNRDQFAYDLNMNCDSRGSFTEITRTADRGQFSVNIIKPGVIKGQHWHHTKNEKFLVVSGQGVIRLRQILSDEVIEYYVSSDKMQIVDIPTGYTHNIENLGSTDMVTFMWCCECFDPNKLDTYFMEV